MTSNQSPARTPQPTRINQPVHYTLLECCWKYGFSVDYFRDLARAGVLPSVRRGGRILINAKAVEQYFAAGDGAAQ